MKKQAFNPYMGEDVYIPDGEPHVFGDRVYVYGSHDKEGGNKFCELDYEVFSAPADDLSDWSSKGIAYRAKQDPDYSKATERMYAPDAVRGNDGRYYLYYAMSGEKFTGHIHVAVSDYPDEKFEYYGCVREADGSEFKRNITFDPAVINDNGVIRLYYGWSLNVPADVIRGKGENFGNELTKALTRLFEMTEEEVKSNLEEIMGCYTVQLEDDMLTVRGTPKKVIPDCVDAVGTEFEGHAFFEASSIRKINGMYYLVYSSENSHELCYAISDKPDGGFKYKGVIISNGDIGYKGRTPKDSVAATGNNHGSIELINGKWYIFYHRQTHKTSFSRQGCAEEIKIAKDGTIEQAEMTSCGLNGGPLKTEGKYPAYIACVLTNGNMPYIRPDRCENRDIPYITDKHGERFITDIADKTVIGFKYFDFKGEHEITVRARGDLGGKFIVKMDDEKAGEITLSKSDCWTEFKTSVRISGVKALYFEYEGEGRGEFIDFEIN